MMYERGGPIQHEPARLTRLCGTSNSAFKSALDVLIRDGKITLSADGNLMNQRVVEELVYSREKQRVAKEAAKTRWHGKDNKINDGHDAPALRPHDGGICRNDAGTDANQNQIDTSSNEDVSARTKSTPQMELGKVLDAEHVSAVIEYRKAKRSALTVHAAKLLASQLGQWPDPNEAADEMMLANWTGFKPAWMERRLETRGHGPPRHRNGLDPMMAAFKEKFDELSEQDETLDTGKLVQLIPPARARGN
jgi:uncharacterized protein YdaU (DUF1376 family)